ncbi:hypothetical protein BH762_gp147 [Gordonia phage OneUp]|uniref:Uncharacterized protein n=1 Tax=Gordonia phage OneUp TaxID=1838074 RepID=A0A160DEU9_9CAUD|nr:hypothetical protein BH762_gp147 [Gordonia phage OneUp]ANA86372.1 hypothetical protein PBI_ONEUP_37 [Gordonia phage OneUp]
MANFERKLLVNNAGHAAYVDNAVDYHNLLARGYSEQATGGSAPAPAAVEPAVSVPAPVGIPPRAADTKSSKK